jgi:hypothetical protein
MGQSHGTRSSFDASTPSYNFGYRYVQGSTNGPGTSGSQFYSWYIGLGSEYPATGAGSYGAMFAVDRNVTTPYLSVRYNENNSFTSWRKVAAGYADTAGSANALNSGNSYTAVSFIATSDVRKKENIEPIRNALDIVRKMVGVYYTMIDDAQKKRRVGWLAQQTEPILPEIVYYQTDNDAYGINYGDSAAVLAEAIKELADRLDALEAKL